MVLLYAGTLGLKHRPELLFALAEAFDDDPCVRVVVVSEGVGADWLRSKSSPGLELLPFQPYEDLPDMLASADVLLVLLEPEAGAYSVPSKVLTYHCAGRPILGAMPSSNLASSIIRTNDSGVVVDPSDIDAFVESARGIWSPTPTNVDVKAPTLEHMPSGRSTSRPSLTDSWASSRMCSSCGDRDGADMSDYCRMRLRVMSC